MLLCLFIQDVVFDHIYEATKLLIAVEGVAFAASLEIINDQHVDTLCMAHLINRGIDALDIERRDIDVGKLPCM